MEIVAIVLLALALPAMAVAGFVMALGLRARTAALELRLAGAEAELTRLRGSAPAAPFVPPVVETPPATEPAPEVMAAPSEAPTPSTVPPPFPEEVAPPPMPPPAAPRPGFEERLGARWAVWVGGVALALGGVFLVRYSIEQGLLGPTARTFIGALFALALLAAGEIMRRRDGDAGIPALPSAHIPAVLTGAGVTSAFATAYAAHALYGLVGPGTAFVLLGAIAVLTMLAAALHGPALAALGLVGALASPLLVDSDAPQVWPLVIYLAFVGTAAYGVARLRLWRWLAVASAAGGALWGLALGAIGGPEIGPVMGHVLLQAALAGFFLLADPYRHATDAESRPDPLAAGALLAFAALGVLVAAEMGPGSGRAGFAAALMALFLTLAARIPAGAPAAAWAALMGVGTLALWPVAAEIAAEPVRVLPQLFGPDALPDAVDAYLGFATLAGLAVAAASLWRVARGRSLPLSTAAWFAGAATLGPLAILTIAWARVSGLAHSIPFALAAGGLALAFTLVTGALRRIDTGAEHGVRLTLGATACAAFAALALGLTIALDRGMLTVALSLSAFGAAWVAGRTDIAPLRWVVGAAGLVVLGRLAWDPTIVGADLGRTPILNWLLWGYGVPALAFLGASRILERGGRDGIVRLAESLAIVFAALLVFFQIRHAATGGDVFRAGWSHLEAGLVACASLAFGILMVRVEAVRPDPVSRIAGLVFGAVSLGVGAVALGVLENPFFTGDPVIGGVLVNSLLAAYLLPAVLAGALALAARGTRPRWYVGGAEVLSLGLVMLYAVLELRRVFQGPVVDLFRATGQGEMWSYSVALLAIGAGLLAFGLRRDVREARLASGLLIGAAVVKVFVVDLSHLEGALRAFSFMGLGLALVGIGLAYQRLLGRAAAGGAVP
ncbi:DUF2339 domain-containing protein [Salinarimonas soli]|uniref:DUF2339 domain-containing protein n=1 Tax=Salinarimonas soli TaxID=1638099 RepID=A0A5B2VNH6_9HYPH|nr:DUF2339 domain-containing protein [Salinarimonas soli]KAA2241213.1 DUF2339 domain-containing protein [Salinarimonas soli]